MSWHDQSPTSTTKHAVSASRPWSRGRVTLLGDAASCASRCSATAPAHLEEFRQFQKQHTEATAASEKYTGFLIQLYSWADYLGAGAPSS